MALALTHPQSLEHETGAHPERPLRLSAIETRLAAEDWLGWEHSSAGPVAPEILELVHPARHVESIFAAAERARTQGGAVLLDADTVVSPGSADAASHAAGGAVEMVRRLVSERDHRVGFSLHRPPGHHAPADRAMGFCLFNSVAVAARYAVQGLGLQRVAIVDWDVHHGNGTQDIFWADPGVLFCSIHQMPLYPGSGAASEIGGGAAEGLTLNLPVPAGAGDGQFCALVDGPVSERVREFAPDLLLVSAGFDAHRDDPLANCTVTEGGYARMGESVRGLAAELEIPLGLVLEGGYAIDALVRSVAATMVAVGKV